MSFLRLYCLGLLELHSDARELRKPPTLKSQSLLVYLAVHRRFPQPRDRLIGLFWGERSERKARRSLSTALWHIRRCLPDPSLLLSDAQTVQIDPDGALWLDAEVFASGVRSADLGAVCDAVRLYRGAFLDGFYDEWVIGERYRLEALYVDALARLMVSEEEAGEPRAALATALRLLSFDALHEGAHRLAMRSYCRLGQRNAALAQYERCRDVVLQELGTTPTVATSDLYEAIVDGRFAVAPTGPAAEVVPGPPGAARSPLDAAARVRVVGRERELALLAGRWEAARASHGSLVLIAGEAGVGKTCLVDTFAQRLRWQGVRVLHGRCYEFERALPFQPLADALQHALPALADDELASLPPWALHAFEQLAPALQERRGAQALAGVRPETEPEASSADMPSAAQDEPQVRLFGALTRLLAVLSRTAPLLLVLEDLHWASTSTLDLLHYVARHLATQAVLVVGTWRPESLGASHPLPTLQRQLVRAGLAHALPLPRLARAAVTAMIVEMSAAGDVVLPLARRLYRETEGNPFFLIEIVKALFETGVIAVEKGVWQGEFGAISEGQLPLPAGVSEAITARVARLDKDGREALRVASVIGREFNFDLLSAVWGRGDEATLEALDHLLRRRLIAEGVDAGSCDFVFTHHLIREVVYSALPRPHRLYWHAQVGAGMEHVYRDELQAYAAELAYHFVRAARLEQTFGTKAVAYLLQAGEQAERQSAHREAIAYYRRALALVPALPPRPQVVRQEIALLLALAAAVAAAEGYAAPATRQVYARARERCRQEGAQPDLFAALIGLSRHYGVSGDLETGEALADQLLTIAENGGETTMLLEAYRQKAGHLFSAGEVAEARRLWQRALAIYDGRQHEQHAHRFGHDPATTCLGYLSITSWLLGRADEACVYSEQLQQLLASMTHPSSLAYGHCLLAIRACLGRVLDEASDQAARAGWLGERHALPPWMAMATALRGWVLVMRDHRSEGLATLKNGIASWRGKGFEHLTSLLLTLEVEACLSLEALEDADAAIAAAMTIVRSGIDRFWTPEVYRLQGEVLRARSSANDRVEKCYRRALEMARRDALRMLELRAAVSMARLWRDQGRAEHGRRLLSEVYCRFDEGLDTPDLEAAGDLLQALGRAAVEA